MKIEFITIINSEDKTPDTLSMHVDGEYFGGFSEESVLDYPEDLTFTRDMRFLLELPEIFKRAITEQAEIVISTMYLKQGRL